MYRQHTIDCSIMSSDPGFVTRHSSSHDLFLQSHPGEADAQDEVLQVGWLFDYASVTFVIKYFLL